MLRCMNESDLKQAAALSASACAARDMQSYPLCEGAEAYGAKYRRWLSDPRGGLLCYESGGRIAGVLGYEFEPEPMYLQTTAFLAWENRAETYAAYVSHLRKRFSGYTAYVGLTAENGLAAEALCTAGFALAEASSDLRLSPTVFTPCAPVSGIQRISEADFTAYASFHDAHFSGIYWNAARLHAAPDGWYIFAYVPDGTILGSIFLKVQGTLAEVFGLAFTGPEEAERAAAPLLSHTLRVVLSENPAVESIVFFADEEDGQSLSAAAACGFITYSRYRLYASVL